MEAKLLKVGWEMETAKFQLFFLWGGLVYIQEHNGMIRFIFRSSSVACRNKSSRHLVFGTHQFRTVEALIFDTNAVLFL